MRSFSAAGRRIRRRQCRPALAAIVTLALAACNAGSVMEPTPRVDVGMETSAIAPMQPVQPAPIAAAPAPDFPQETLYGEPPEPAFGQQKPHAGPGLSAEAGPPTLYPEQPESIEAPQAAEAPQEMPGFQPPAVVSGPQVVETPAAAPVQVASAAGMSSRSLMAGYPRAEAPMTPAPGLPESEIRCRQELRKLGVEFRDLAPINDGGACRVDHPVKVSLLPQGVNLRPAATLTCRMALTFARWTKNELTPAARTRYLSGIRTIHQGSSYSCRNIRTSRNRTPSEHSRGNAIDIMRIELKSGKDIDVRKPGFFAFREKGLLNNVRGDACRYFSTVLGPGYDRDHKDHFHFDLMSRRNGRVACR